MSPPIGWKKKLTYAALTTIFFFAGLEVAARVVGNEQIEALHNWFEQVEGEDISRRVNDRCLAQSLAARSGSIFKPRLRTPFALAKN